MRVQSRPTFFLFLVLSPFVVIPFLMLFPMQITFSAAWRESRNWLWRCLIVASVLLAVVITCPASPLFQGLESPIPIRNISFESAVLRSMKPLLVPQLLLINAAFVSLCVCFPVALASTIVRLLKRQRT